jgi:hypothetical protein
MKPIKMIIYSVGGLLMLSVLFFLFSFGYTSLETISAQNIQSRLMEVQKRANEWEKEHEEWMNVGDKYKRFKDEYMLKSERFDHFKQELQTILRKNGLGFAPLKYNITTMFFDMVKISIKIELNGAYENIKRFIHEMENKKEMILFRNIELNKTKTGPTVEGEFVVEVYFAR